ncbi:amidohydrolase [Peptoniphilaceae bacterium SGI.131]
MLLEKLYKILESKEGQMIEHRRWLHQHPELSFQEKKTSKYIYDFYKNKDVKIETFESCYGLKITIDSGKPGKTIALRADFDALPIMEDTGLDFASQNKGVMHACGHDGHTSYLLTLADAFLEMKDDLKGKIVLIHQPAEEFPPGGAIQMIKEGALNGVDSVFGCHFLSTLDLGTINYHHRETQHARSKFNIKVYGKGGHGSSPHQANDAILIASQLVVNLQTIVSRRTNPMDSAVLTIGSFDAKGQFNIIKDFVELEGDVRFISKNAKETLERELKRICQGLEIAYNCKIIVEYTDDYPILINDVEMTDLLIRALNKADIKEVNKIEDGGILTISEDFAYYNQKIPSSFYFIGANPNVSGESYPHHHPKFNISEKAMLIAAKAAGAVAFEFLGIE